jgi:hypothetical protein
MVAATMTELKSMENKLLDQPTRFTNVDVYENNEYGGITLICQDPDQVKYAESGVEYKIIYTHSFHFDKKGRRQKVSTWLHVNGSPIREMITKRTVCQRVADVMFPF